MVKKSKYLILDESHNAMDYLIQSLVFLSQVEQNLFYLKWFIISFHGAIYGFILLVLKSKDQQQIYEIPPEYSRGKSRKKEFDPFEGKLISFLVAYKYLKDSQKMAGQPFVASREHDQCMKELNNKLRGQLIHFKPMLWASESWYPARVCQPLLDILRFCVKYDRIHLEQSEKDTALAYLDSIERLLAKHVV